MEQSESQSAAIEMSELRLPGSMEGGDLDSVLTGDVVQVAEVQVGWLTMSFECRVKLL